MSFNQGIRVSRLSDWRMDSVKRLFHKAKSLPDREARIRKYTERAARGLPLFGDDDG